MIISINRKKNLPTHDNKQVFLYLKSKWWYYKFFVIDKSS